MSVLLGCTAWPKYLLFSSFCFDTHLDQECSRFQRRWLAGQTQQHFYASCTRICYWLRTYGWRLGEFNEYLKSGLQKWTMANPFIHYRQYFSWAVCPNWNTAIFKKWHAENVDWLIHKKLLQKLSLSNNIDEILPTVNTKDYDRETQFWSITAPKIWLLQLLIVHFGRNLWGEEYQCPKFDWSRVEVCRKFHE